MAVTGALVFAGAESALITNQIAAPPREDGSLMPRDPKVLLSELLPDELADRVRQRPLAVIPIGSIEYHGPQNAFCVDIAQAEIPCWEAVRRKGGVCVDSVYWGGRAGHAFFPGSMLVRTSVVRDLLIDIIENLRQAGFRAVLGVTGHAAGGHLEALKEVQERYRDDPLLVVELVSVGELAGKRGMEKRYNLDRGVWDHGGANETSNLKASAPHRVDLSKLPPAGADLPFVALEGVDPHLATEEYGRRVLEAVTEAIVLETDELLAKALARPLPEKTPASLAIVFETENALKQYAVGTKKNLILLINGGIQKMIPVEKGRTEYQADGLWAGQWGVYVWSLGDGPGAGRGRGSLYKDATLQAGRNELRF